MRHVPHLFLTSWLLNKAAKADVTFVIYVIYTVFTKAKPWQMNNFTESAIDRHKFTTCTVYGIKHSLGIARRRDASMHGVVRVSLLRRMIGNE